ncbi:MAG: helix-turn-helix domain-containing protein [Patescibacteria group bacterium]|nr:helix-turn-helix domain-containing protein [Patescibacteria group bacterium]MDD4610933.1 helix-turn-helix domain-containing protein [Patescibacteria group bacterium]
MDLIILKKLGLQDKEIKIYLKLLESGAISVRELAQISGLNRGTTYDILKRLQESGLVSYYHQKTKQKFIAEDPEKLLKLVKNKEDEIKAAKDKISEIIPELKSLQDKGGYKPTTKFYEGNSGVREILEDLLETMELTNEKEREYFVYSATKASKDINKAYPNFTYDRIKKKIRVKSISLAKGGGLHGLDERRWLGINDESATFIIIYKDKCAFISQDAHNQPVGVIIENKMIYETQKNIFLKLWGLIK